MKKKDKACFKKRSKKKKEGKEVLCISTMEQMIEKEYITINLEQTDKKKEDKEKQTNKRPQIMKMGMREGGISSVKLIPC